MKFLPIQKILAPLLCTALILVGGVHQADAETVLTSGTTVVYSGSVKNLSKAFSIDTFNTNLGTLTKVTVTLSGSNVSTYIKLINNVGTVDSGNAYSDVTLSLTGISSTTLPSLLVTTGTTPFTAPANGTVYVTTSATSGSATADYSDGLILSDFSSEGDGTLQLTLSGEVTSRGKRSEYTTELTDTATGDVKVTVTYTYTTVPEPSTWAMIVGGIGMLALGQRMRRRSR